MVLTRSAKRELEDKKDERPSKKSKNDDPDNLNDALSDSDYEDSDKDDVIVLFDEDDTDISFDEDGEITVDYDTIIKLLRETSPEVADNLEQVVKTIHDKTPNFMDILSENVDHEHRVKLLELYEALKEIELAGLAGHPTKLEYSSQMKLHFGTYVISRAYARRTSCFLMTTN